MHPPKNPRLPWISTLPTTPAVSRGGEGLSFLQQDIGVGGVLNSAWVDELVRGGYSMNVAPAMRSEVQVKLQWAYSKTVRESQP